ncbi:GGDEF domain-containing protein [Acidithiobacillus sp. HP-6]|nr:GGDEF domain-containing protein [Acidithiobacillus sp. HP-6]MBE7568739.1 GGDEF domain-containing protein [Acidithiobacillus sp. HP-2]
METYFFHAILSAQRNRTSLAVLLIDLDDFKPVNDTYGHEAGDRLLVRVAGALQDAIRNTDFLVRLGETNLIFYWRVCIRRMICCRSWIIFTKP